MKYYCIKYSQKHPNDPVYYNLPIPHGITADREIAERLFAFNLKQIEKDSNRELIAVCDAPTAFYVKKAVFRCSGSSYVNTDYLMELKEIAL